MLYSDNGKVKSVLCGLLRKHHVQSNGKERDLGFENLSPRLGAARTWERRDHTNFESFMRKLAGPIRVLKIRFQGFNDYLEADLKKAGERNLNFPCLSLTIIVRLPAISSNFMRWDPGLTLKPIFLENSN